ncbi:MAG: prohibitin family protein [Chloroflexi bacterium]|mgnify:CR=1|nr:prohibitin family protein [Chloroflexota bacterium]
MFDGKFTNTNPQAGKPVDPKAVKTGRSIVIGIVAVVLALIIISSAVSIIPAGNIGVVTRWGAAHRVIQPGINLRIPFMEQVVLMSIRTQKDQVEATAMSKNLQVVTSSIAVNYHLDGAQAMKVYQDIGTQYTDIIVAPAVQNTFKAVTALFTAEELITVRDQVRIKAEEELSKQLEPYNIIVENFNIINFDFSPEFQSAIEAKQVAQQAVETAKQRLLQAEIDAQATVAQAQGQADAQKALKNTGALTQEYLNYLFLTKWNGILPSVMGGTTPMIDVSQFLGGQK